MTPPLDTNKGEPMKTLPEILAQLVWEFSLLRNLYDLEEITATKQGKLEREELNATAQAIAKELMGCLPEKKNRKTDVEYGYCITCNQNIDYAEADCFCTIHNLALDEVRARLTAFIGKEEK